MSITGRTTLHDLVKAAGAGVEARASVTAEALRQSAIAAGEPVEKIASAAGPTVTHVPTEDIHKIAAAMDFLAGEFQKEAETPGPGAGPGALSVLEATSSEKNIDAGEMGTATGKHTPPKSPSLQGEQVQSGKANTGLETNDGMQHAEQPTDPWSNEKSTNAPQAGTENKTHATPQAQPTKISHALVARNMQRLGLGQEKIAQVSLEQRNMARLGLSKVAEDAINPASVSSGAQTPPAASASEEGVPAKPSDAEAQAKLVASNTGAIDYTKRQAKANPVGDVEKVLTEPAQSKATDKTLHSVLDNTDAAGAKISSVRDQAIKTAASRALLHNLIEKSAEEKKKVDAKKEKDAQGMGMATPPPSPLMGGAAG